MEYANITANSLTSVPFSEDVRETHSQLHIKQFSMKCDKYNSNTYYVYVESTDNHNLGRLHALKVGHILHKKFHVNNITEIKSIGKSRVRIHLKTKLDANNLVTNKQLATENLRAFIPNHLLEIKGLIRGVDTFFENYYLKDNIISPSPVTDITRMKKKLLSMVRLLL